MLRYNQCHLCFIKKICRIKYENYWKYTFLLIGKYFKKLVTPTDTYTQIYPTAIKSVLRLSFIFAPYAIVPYILYWAKIHVCWDRGCMGRAMYFCDFFSIFFLFLFFSSLFFRSRGVFAFEMEATLLCIRV